MTGVSIENIFSIIDCPSDLNDCLKEDKNRSFVDKLVKFINAMVARNFISIEDTLKEVANMELDIRLNMERLGDIAIYNDYIDTLQGYRDRMVYLISDSHDDQIFMDSYYEHLFTIWSAHYSDKKTKDQREGEAELILDFMFKPRLERQMLHERLKRIGSNLDSKMQAISRKISVLQQVYQHSQPYTGTPDADRSKRTAIFENHARLQNKRDEGGEKIE